MKILNISARRYYTSLDNFETAIRFHERITGATASRFDYERYRLKIAGLSSILFIAGDEEDVKPFRDVHMTFLVDDIKAWQKHLPTIGAEIVEAVKAVPTGWNMHARHPDGSLVEYVQLKMQPRAPAAHNS